MRLTSVRSASVFGVGLALAAGLGQGDTRLPMALPAVPATGQLALFTSLPWTLAQTPKPHAAIPKLRVAPRPLTALPHAPSPRAPGDVLPHSYLVYGLRTGPGGMAFTDSNGAVIPVPSNAQIHMGPFTSRPAFPQVLPPVVVVP